MLKNIKLRGIFKVHFLSFWRILKKIIYLKKCLICQISRVYSIRYLAEFIKLITSPWIEFKTFENISNYAGEFLFDKPNELYYCEPLFDHNSIIKPKLTLVSGYKEYSVILDSVKIIGGSNLILLFEDKVIYDLIHNDKNHKFRYTDKAIIYTNNEFCVIKAERRTNKLTTWIDKGVFLCGNYSWNYYHFIFEILIKLYQLDGLNLNKNIPILIDRICVEIPQYHELLTILNKDKRKLIALESGKKYFVNRLYYFSCPNIIPPNFINDRNIKAEDVLFDLETINYLRHNLLTYKSNSKFSHRLFISRSKASRRRQFNEDDVFEELRKYYFEKVHPEDYSIRDQIAMFNNAKIIIGGSGAAFTNILFCKPKCKILILSNSKIPFSGFSTIANHIGIEMCYLASDIYPRDNIHEKFNINTEKLISIINSWI